LLLIGGKIKLILLEAHMPWIAAALIGSSIYQADVAKKESKKARAQAQQQATAASQMASQQLSAQQEQAKIARERLDFEISRSSADRARLESESKKMAEEIEAQQRKLAQEESARMSAARRGGRRSLLSQERLTPELGVSGYDQINLGSGMSM
jgi:predicted  nucleic acid-binding Zn-ribbon protein